MTSTLSWAGLKTFFSTSREHLFVQAQISHQQQGPLRKPWRKPERKKLQAQLT
jgi:hypothetical protein